MTDIRERCQNMMAKCPAAIGLLIDSTGRHPLEWKISSWNSDKFYYVKLPKEIVGCLPAEIQEELCRQLIEARVRLGT